MYYKPFIYTASHYILGAMSYYCPLITILFIIYQFGQLIINKRFFIFSLEFKDGNNINHTFYKLLEFYLAQKIYKLII